MGSLNTISRNNISIVISSIELLVCILFIHDFFPRRRTFRLYWDFKNKLKTITQFYPTKEFNDHSYLENWNGQKLEIFTRYCCKKAKITSFSIWIPSFLTLVSRDHLWPFMIYCYVLTTYTAWACFCCKICHVHCALFWKFFLNVLVQMLIQSCPLVT